ncbi:MAG TPA: sigma-E processing peptidase SpoIIGA [Bacillaceae bacterium]
MVLYADVIWLLNLLVDCLLLWLTAIMLKRTVPRWRIFLGGLAGSSIIFLSFSPYSFLAVNPALKLGLSCMMVLIVFGFKRIKFFMAGLLTFYFATFLMGGILLGTHYFLAFDLELRSSHAMAGLQGFGDPVSWIFVMAAFPAAWIFSKRRVEGISGSRLEYEVLADVSVSINGAAFTLKGLIDSGNHLTDPLTGTPVMIVSAKAAGDALPKSISLLEGNMDPFDAAADLPPEWMDRMRLIPAKTLGQNHQLLCAFKPDSVMVEYENRQYKTSKALIVFSGQTLSGDGAFQCILHPRMIGNGWVKSAS